MVTKSHKKYLDVFLYDQNIIGSSSKIFGKCSETIVRPSENFWNLRIIVKQSSLVCLYKYMAACRYGTFSSRVHISFAALTCEISSWTLEEKFRAPYLGAPMYYPVYIWQGYLRFSYYFMTFRIDKIQWSSVFFYQWGHSLWCFEP